MRPDLDSWVAEPLIRVVHRRESVVGPEALWAAARTIRLRDTRALGHLIRVRIPGVDADISFDRLFQAPPFTVLQEDEGALVSGLVGRIWTLRRDYPLLADPTEFREWRARGTVRVLFATWTEPIGSGAGALASEVRIDAVDRSARLGLTAVRPLIHTSHSLIGSDALAVAVRRAAAIGAAGGGDDEDHTGL